MDNVEFVRRIEALRRQWEGEEKSFASLSHTFTLDRVERFKAKAQADKRRWALKEIKAALE